MPEPINFDSRSPRPEPERVHLFTLDGEDYYIPAEISPGVALRYLYELRLNGEMHAAAGLLFAVIGEPAMQALSNSDQVTADDVKVIMEIVRERAMGAIEAGN